MNGTKVLSLITKKANYSWAQVFDSSDITKEYRLDGKLSPWCWNTSISLSQLGREWAVDLENIFTKWKHPQHQNEWFFFTTRKGNIVLEVMVHHRHVPTGEQWRVGSLAVILLHYNNHLNNLIQFVHVIIIVNWSNSTEWVNPTELKFICESTLLCLI